MPPNSQRDRKVQDRPAREIALTADKSPLVDLSAGPNDRDDRSDAGRPTTDQESSGWRGTPPVKP